MKKRILKEYAKLIVNVGANVQKGQEVNIVAELEQADFVVMLVEAAYKRKAKRVTIDWVDDRLTLLNNKYQKVETCVFRISKYLVILNRGMSRQVFRNCTLLRQNVLKKGYLPGKILSLPFLPPVERRLLLKWRCTMP